MGISTPLDSISMTSTILERLLRSFLYRLRSFLNLVVYTSLRFLISKQRRFYCFASSSIHGASIATALSVYAGFCRLGIIRSIPHSVEQGLNVVA